MSRKQPKTYKGTMVRLLQPIYDGQTLHKRGDEIAWPYDDPPDANIAVDVSDDRPNTFR